METSMITEVAHWIVLTALHDERLLAVKGELRSLPTKLKVEELVAHGCDNETLLNILAFATELPDLYPPFTAASLTQLSRDLESVLNRIKRYTPSIALPWAYDSEDGKTEIRFRPTGGDLHLWPEAEQDLRKKIEMYKVLAEMCKRREIPTRATLKRMAFLWPVVYVKKCTGKPHYREVAELLQLAGFSTSTLKIKFRDVSRKYPGIVEWIELATQWLQPSSVVLSDIRTKERDNAT